MALFNHSWSDEPERRGQSRHTLWDMVKHAEGKVEELDAELSEDLFRAVASGDRDAVAYLLWAGVTPRFKQAQAIRTIMQNALCNRDLEMARLLSDHHASFMPSGEALEPGADPPSAVAQTATYMWSWFAKNVYLWDPANEHLGCNHPTLLWLSGRPTSTRTGTAGVACKFHKRLVRANSHYHNMYNLYRTSYSMLRDTRTNPDFDVSHVDVLRSWPPRGKPQWPPPASVANATLRPATHFNMLEYWSRIRRLRRAEAAYAAKDHWKKLRMFVRRAIPIALYWQEVTQKRICAPGGVGRKRDFDAYQADGF
jgi:hypothetical protein